jgi:hypothetical protein
LCLSEITLGIICIALFLFMTKGMDSE